MNPEFDGPRPPASHEVPEVLGFLKNSLRPEKPWELFQEYPLVFQESNLQNLRIIKKGEEVLCHAAVKPLILKTTWGLIKAAGIGSVVTKESYRKQGLSAQTMNSCLETAELMGCEIAILWTDLYDFYRKLGFELAGAEIHLKITERFQPPQHSFKVLQGAQVDPQALMRLYSQHRVATLRREADFKAHLQIPNSRVYTSWDEHGALCAYAVEGKGADLDGYIHEWGGGVRALAALIHHIRSEQKRDLTVLSPGHSENLIRQFERFGASKVHGFLGMIKLLRTERLFGKIQQHARKQGVPLILQQTGSSYQVGLKDDLLQITDEMDLVKILFGPTRPSEFAVWSPDTSLELDKVLPVPFWIWGWDSV